MGSGKTTLGKILSKKLDKTFFDSDQVIEEKLGVDVPMIFEYEGEAGFREREKEILKELVSKKNIIYNKTPVRSCTCRGGQRRQKI